MSRPATTRREARERGLPVYFPVNLCHKGHALGRQTGNKNCIGCRRERDNARHASPSQKLKRAAYDKARWENNRAYIVSKNRRYYTSNRDAVNAQKRGYYRVNRKRAARASKLWRMENHHAVIEIVTRRKVRVKQATPPWADFEKIRAVYALAKKRSDLTGVKHHVDHRIPLTGDLVCGLHVHNNLRAIPWQVNASKKNKFKVAA